MGWAILGSDLGRHKRFSDSPNLPDRLLYLTKAPLHFSLAFFFGGKSGQDVKLTTDLGPRRRMSGVKRHIHPLTYMP
jgi:hypothetical protein